MLEASQNDQEAAQVYAETAILQLQNEMFDSALRTLRRLNRLNETNFGQFESQLSQAVEFIKSR